MATKLWGLALVASLGLLAIGCGDGGDPNVPPPPDKAALENEPLPAGDPPGTMTPGVPGAQQAPQTMGLPGGKGAK